MGTRKNVRVLRDFELDDVFWETKEKSWRCDNSSDNGSSYAEFTVIYRDEIRRVLPVFQYRRLNKFKKIFLKKFLRKRQNGYEI